MASTIQIPTSPEAVCIPPLFPVRSTFVSGLVGAWIASGRRGEPVIAPGSVVGMPFKVQDTDFDYNPNLEEKLNQFEVDGFSFLTVIPGLQACSTSEGYFDGQPPKIVMHKSPFADLVAQVLALIDQLDSIQIVQLIDGLPDRVTDPICERCDLEDGVDSVDPDDLRIPAFIPPPSVFTMNAAALVANSSDPNADELPF